MPRSFLVCVLCSLAAGADGVDLPTDHCFRNPLPVQLADPFVFREDGTYYLYGTHDRDPSAGVPVYTSDDLVRWRFRGFVLTPGPGTWAKRHFWGPEVLHIGGVYRLYFNASPNTDDAPPLRMALCVAEAESPLGPFHEIAAPWYRPQTPGDEAIDQHVFHDQDGRLYLYFTLVTVGRNEIHVAPLEPGGLVFADTPRLCVAPEQAWERHAWHGHVVNEGAWVIRRDDWYYLIFTANHFLDPRYAMGYAVSRSPLGPWRKASGNPVLSASEAFHGPGNGCFIRSPGGTETWVLYHVHQSVRQPGWRSLAMDRAHFAPGEDGAAERLVITGPRNGLQPLPDGAQPWRPAEPERFSTGFPDRSHWLVVNENPANWWLEQDGLCVRTADGDLWQERADFESLFLQWVGGADVEAVTALRFRPEEDYEQAFLCLYGDHDNYVRLSLVHDGMPRVAVAVEEQGVFRQTSLPLQAVTEWLELRLTRVHGQCDFAFRPVPDGDWTSVPAAGPFPNDLDFMGLGAISPGSGIPRVATFRDILVRFPSGPSPRRQR